MHYIYRLIRKRYQISFFFFNIALLVQSEEARALPRAQPPRPSSAPVSLSLSLSLSSHAEELFSMSRSASLTAGFLRLWFSSNTSFSKAGEKMSRSALLFLLWLFGTSLAAFPNQINIGECVRICLTSLAMYVDVWFRCMRMIRW